MSSCVSPQERASFFPMGLPRRSTFILSPPKCPECFQPGLDYSNREEDRDQVKLERQPDLKPPSVGLYPKDNEKLMGFECVCV